MPCHTINMFCRGVKQDGLGDWKRPLAEGTGVVCDITKGWFEPFLISDEFASKGWRLNTTRIHCQSERCTVSGNIHAYTVTPVDKSFPQSQLLVSLSTCAQWVFGGTSLLSLFIFIFSFSYWTSAPSSFAPCFFLFLLHTPHMPSTPAQPTRWRSFV